jgi:hypothetical protein
VSTPAALATAARLGSLLQQVMDALRSGVAASTKIHAEQGWNPVADPHTSHGLVRREAMERLKPYGARLEDGDNLGLPMSGLILRSAAGDVLRVWYSEDGELPPVTSRPMRRFCHQHPTDQGALFIADPSDSVPTGNENPTNNLAVLWNDDGTDLTRFDLVRPYGVDGRRALVDWQVNLLGRIASVDDLDFGDRASGARGELG